MAHTKTEKLYNVIIRLHIRWKTKKENISDGEKTELSNSLLKYSSVYLFKKQKCSAFTLKSYKNKIDRISLFEKESISKTRSDSARLSIKKLVDAKRMKAQMLLLSAISEQEKINEIAEIQKNIMYHIFNWQYLAKGNEVVYEGVIQEVMKTMK
jgi:hypothetical protein